MFFLVALVFSTRLDIQFTLPKLVIIRAFTPILAGFWVLRLARNEVRPLPVVVFAAGIALSVWWVISSVFAVHPPTALNGAHGRYNGLWNQETFFFLFLIVASSQFERTGIERLIKLLLAALVPVSLYALVQYVGWDPLPWRVDRSASTIGNPVILAATLGLGLPFALVFLMLTRRRAERFVWGAILLILLLAAMTTRSRGPLIASSLALLLILGIVAWEMRERLNRWVIAAVFAAAVPGLVLGYRQVTRGRPDLQTVTSQEADPAIRDRLNTFAAATQMVRDHPLTGVGLENFSVLYPRYRSAESEQFTPDELPTMVHNGYLQAAATTGIPGLFLYLLFLWSVLLFLWKAYRRLADTRARWLVLAFLASVSGYLIQDLSGWLEISLSAFFWIILGLGVALCSDQPVARVYSRRVRLTAYATAGVCSIVAVWLAVRSVAMIRTDALAAHAQKLSVKDDWPSIETDISEALKYSSGDAVYLDKAGLRYSDRYGTSSERDTYERGAFLLEEAHRLDPFNPYFLIHRVALETTALQKATIKRASRTASDMIPIVLAMDRNNAAGYASAAQLKWAEGKFGEALPLIERGNALRPKQGRFRVLEGDIRRALNDGSGAIDAYRRGLALLLDSGDPESIATDHKLIVMFAQAGSYQAAVDEAQRLIARAPADAMAYTLLGIAHHAMNNLGAARQAFASALQLNPADENARQGLQQVEEQFSKN